MYPIQIDPLIEVSLSLLSQHLRNWMLYQPCTKLYILSDFLKLDVILKSLFSLVKKYSFLNNFAVKFETR